MKGMTSARRAVSAVLGGVLLLGIVPGVDRSGAAHAAKPTRNLAVMAAQWWQWVSGIPTGRNPLLDETGEFAGEDQPYKGNKVFFLGGVFNETGEAERSITVAPGTAFFFPVLNTIFVDEKGRGRFPEDNPTVPQLRAIVRDQIDLVESLYVVLDGDDLTGLSERIMSPPFAIRLPEDNIFGAHAGTYAPGVTDGYWFFLPPLTEGTHTLQFGGKYADGSFELDITYYITVE